jgi:hypothetical protein
MEKADLGLLFLRTYSQFFVLKILKFFDAHPDPG